MPDTMLSPAALRDLLAPPMGPHTALAMEMANDTMAPRYRCGETIYVACTRAPKIGDFVVALLEARGERRYLGGKLVERSACKVVLRHLNPERDFHLGADQVLGLYPIAYAGEPEIFRGDPTRYDARQA